jgi:hypothetical protein
MARPDAPEPFRFLGFGVIDQSSRGAIAPYWWRRQRGVIFPHWVAVVVTSFLPVRWARVRARDQRRQRTGLCAKCGYNLTANLSGVCPECGGGAA